MKKIIAAALTICFLLAACHTGSPQSDTVHPDENSALPESARILSQHEDVFGGLTLEEMQEDLDFLWTTMQQSYPFLGAARRMWIDGEHLYLVYSALLPQATGDLDFRERVNNFIGEFQGLGHLGLIYDSADYENIRNTYETYSEMYPDWTHLRILCDNLNHPVSVKSYDRLAELDRQRSALGDSEVGESTQSAPDADKSASEALWGENVRTEILRPGSIAYLKIAEMADPWDDRQQFADFYEQIADYEHLIIDITGNGGGNSGYWLQNVVIPNLSQTTSHEQIILVPDSPEVVEYVLSADPDRELLPLSQLPELPALEPDDLESLAFFYTRRETYEPAGAPAFSGQIWVLIDGDVYSSSEGFAYFCKTTGFATLVGSQSRGDGSLLDPLYIALPNCGLVVRMSTVYPTNPDGSCNTERGTAPDIASPAGETALDTCLKAIG